MAAGDGDGGRHPPPRPDHRQPEGRRPGGRSHAVGRKECRYASLNARVSCSRSRRWAPWTSLVSRCARRYFAPPRTCCPKVQILSRAVSPKRTTVAPSGDATKGDRFIRRALAVALHDADDVVHDARHSTLSACRLRPAAPGPAGTVVSGMMPPATTGAGHALGAEQRTTSGTSSRWLPDRIDRPMMSTSSSRATAAICSGVSRMPW